MASTPKEPTVNPDRNLHITSIEDCGPTVKLHWIAEDGEKGYTEVIRERAMQFFPGLVGPTPGLFETIKKINDNPEI